MVIRVSNTNPGKRVHPVSLVDCVSPMVSCVSATKAARYSVSVTMELGLHKERKWTVTDLCDRSVQNKKGIESHSSLYNRVSVPYCFRFFWIGPYPAKDYIGNETCEERINNENIPCRRPIVATHNDNIPDTVDLWAKYKHNPDAIACAMIPGQLCVKYTYFHNKAVQNITYMCAKVNTTTGCYRQKFISGSEVEVCVCESELGGMPCNNTRKTRTNKKSHRRHEDNVQE
ncbi:uncharacterized protein LOC133325029 [Musca vetustissima]|uniref:uncharacterized protein LOC133325029 n=1 Tax=Musca vetustissima TaxID=27455 RepID=UPI002AB6711E|nr:uncharacterized protein LOC133325029 [Musca vetustissima]